MIMAANLAVPIKSTSSVRKPQDFHGNYGLGAELPIAGLLDTATHTSPNTFKTVFIEKVNNFPVN